MQNLSKEKIHNYIFYFLIVLYSFSIPLWRKITPLIVILLFINWLIELDFKKKYLRLIQKPGIYFFFAFIIFYLVHYLGLINTINFEFANFDLEIKMTFLLFPLLLFTTDISFIDNSKLKIILLSYIFGCFISLIISIINSLYMYLATDSIMWFFYVYISYFYHSSYISMYIVFAIGNIYYLLINNMLNNKSLKYFLYFLIICFSVYIVLLSSKAGIISLVIGTILVYSYLIIRKIKIILSTILLIIYFTSIIAGIKSIPSSINRLTPALEAVRASKHDVNMEDGTVQRIEIWKCSFEIFKDNPILGVGTGDVKDELFKKYDEKGMTFAKSFKLNSHSQYFQTAVTLGIFGLLSLVIMLIAPFIYALKTRNYLYLYFIIIVGFCISVESMFENQAGVLFFTFFLSFLFLFSDKLKNS